MKVQDILEMDLKRSPIIVIDESLDKHLDDEIPQYKIDSLIDSVRNTNLLDILKKHNIVKQ